MKEAVRLDPGTGVRYEAEVFGEPGSRLFGARCLPANPPFAGVVVCSPIHAEFPKNYRREVLLSRLLASRGLAVQRFHYRGTGHSDGDSSETTFATMCDDARLAGERLMHQTGVDRVAVVGSRLGALVAAAAFAQAPGALWEPVHARDHYFREIFRARLISDLKRGKTSERPSASLGEELLEAGRVDVLGYSLERSLYESLKGHDLEGHLRRRSGPTLLVQLGGEHLRSEYVGVLASAGSQGSALAAAVVALDVTWWLDRQTWRRDAAVTKASPLLDLTADWLLGRLC